MTQEPSERYFPRFLKPTVEPTQKSAATQESSQKFTFQQRELNDIEAIKELLLQHKTQAEIAQKIGCTREGVNKKISKWSQTDDFREWLSNAWLKQYNEFSLDEKTKIEAFKQLTRWMCALSTRKTEVKAEVTETIEAHVTITTEQLLKEYETALREATEKTPTIPTDNNRKPLHQTETPP